MSTRHIVVLPGDGIGPEVVTAALQVLAAASEMFGLDLQLEHGLIGAAAVHATGDPLPPATRAAVQRADAVLLGAVGDPSLDAAPRHQKPETGLLALRKLLGVYANLRPVMIHPPLRNRSPLRPELLEHTDLLIVRELTGGLYYGEPRGNDGVNAVNTLRYSRAEVERVARVAFASARGPRSLITTTTTKRTGTSLFSIPGRRPRPVDASSARSNTLRRIRSCSLTEMG